MFFFQSRSSDHLRYCWRTWSSGLVHVALVQLQIYNTNIDIYEFNILSLTIFCILIKKNAKKLAFSLVISDVWSPLYQHNHTVHNHWDLCADTHTHVLCSEGVVVGVLMLMFNCTSSLLQDKNSRSGTSIVIWHLHLIQSACRPTSLKLLC